MGSRVVPVGLCSASGDHPIKSVTRPVFGSCGHLPHRFVGDVIQRALRHLQRMGPTQPLSGGSGPWGKPGSERVAHGAGGFLAWTNANRSSVFADDKQRIRRGGVCHVHRPSPGRWAGSAETVNPPTQPYRERPVCNPDATRERSLQSGATQRPVRTERANPRRGKGNPSPAAAARGPTGPPGASRRSQGPEPPHASPEPASAMPRPPPRVPGRPGARASGEGSGHHQPPGPGPPWARQPPKCCRFCCRAVREPPSFPKDLRGVRFPPRPLILSRVRGERCNRSSRSRAVRASGEPGRTGPSRRNRRTQRMQTA